MTQTPIHTIDALLQPRLTATALDFWSQARANLSQDINPVRFNTLFAVASRHAKRTPLALSGAELTAANNCVPGWNPSHWNLLELLRVGLITARADLATAAFSHSFETQFTFADEGETCALYRSLALLPDGERFVWRAGEGCRSNMLTVFCAIALDTPYPAAHFNATGWNQLVIKALFIEQPLGRIVGLDNRLSAELTRMALDFAEERESAGRPVPRDLWLCLDTHDWPRTQALALRLWPTANLANRSAIALGLARAGMADHIPTTDTCEPNLARTLACAQSGQHTQTDFARLTAEANESTL